jgi:hypothetical protein
VTGSVGLVIVLLVLGAVLAWIFIGPGRSRRVDPGHPSRSDSIDLDALAEAEEEVRDVDALASPEEAKQDLPDWGPGAPKP